MKISTLLIRAILLPVAVLSLAAHDGAGPRVVAVDQAGYPRVFVKFVFASQAADSFAVELTATGETVFRGPMTLWKSPDAATGRTVYRGDFSALQHAGRYRVVTSHGDSSSAFMISDSVYDEVFRKSLRGFYLQRCGMALLPDHAGVYWHAVCHTRDAVFHSSADTSGYRSLMGGWHDAGDYGKYVINAGISAGTLLLACEMFPSRFSCDDLGIPESGNGVPDILDEVRYELQWFLGMQRWDGGFWFKLTREQFEGFVMPMNDTGARYVYAVSSAATGDAVAVLAKSARLFAPYDTAFSRTCLDAAKRGWQYLAAHPGIVPAGGFRNPAGTATGEYGDADDSDERQWAAAELFETTGDSLYHEHLKISFAAASQFDRNLWWGYVRPLGLLTYMRSQQPSALTGLKEKLRLSLITYCNSQVVRRNLSGYHVVLQPGEYNWGSNSGAMNAAVLLLAGGVETGDTSFVFAAADQLHYVLGANGLSRSFVTGIGENPPMQPHHRPSGSDGIADPVPGLLVGGPDQYRSDDVLRALYTSSSPPALCYADSLPSYASNEIAINWNAPLVFVAGFFGSFAGPTDVRWGGMTPPSEFILEQNFPNPFNPSTTIQFSIADPRFTILRVYDLLGREVAVLVDDRKEAGVHAATFDGTGFSSGVYFYRMQIRPLNSAIGLDSRSGAGDLVQTRRLVLLR